MPPLPKIKDESNVKATRLNHHRVFLTAVLAGLLAFAGCVATQNKALDAERQSLSQMSSSLEQRSFDVSHDILVKAFINAFANKNLIVLTLEKDAGFIMADGAEFLNKGTLINIATERNSRFNAQPGMMGNHSIPNVNLKATVNLYKKEAKRTLVKMKIISIQKNCMRLVQGTFMDSGEKESQCPPSPMMVSLWYQQLWDEIEKSIFMQRETILE